MKNRLVTVIAILTIFVVSGCNDGIDTAIQDNVAIVETSSDVNYTHEEAKSVTNEPGEPDEESSGEEVGLDLGTDNTSDEGNIEEAETPPEATDSIQDDKPLRFEVTEIDDITFEMMDGLSFQKNPHISRADLRLVYVIYNNLEGEEEAGVLCVHKAIADDIKDIFYELYLVKYPIAKIQLVDYYGGDDDMSMLANNTSGFNYRVVAGSDKLSNHAYGLAVDINPLMNPYVTSRGIFPPEGEIYTDRALAIPGMVLKDDACYVAFTSRGFRWGGDWVNSKDYQHFDIKIEGINQ